MTEIVTIADRPDLAPVVANWLWHEWGRPYGYPYERTLNTVSRSTSRLGPQQTFILLVDAEPVGTSSLVTHDLDERPDLTPWLAGVFVTPKARRNGYVIPLMQAVEAAAVAASISTLWLHTEHAERIYAKAEWDRVEIVQRSGKPPVTLMRKELETGGPNY